MEIICKDGTRASIRVPLPVGEPENPAPAERYRQKFMDLSRDVWSGPRQRAILERIAHLEELEGRGREVCFVIGGSLGLSGEVLDRAEETLSLSSLTFPHRLARLMMLEQLYRCFKIMHHEAYHK